MDTHQETHLNDYLGILKERWVIIFIFLICTVSLVTYGSFSMQPIYKASVMLLIDQESPDVLTSSGTVALEKQNFYAYKEYYQSQKEIIKSLSIINKVYKEFNIGSSEDYLDEEEPLKEFLKTIRVEPIRETRLMRLSVENKNPRLAAKIANRIAEIYIIRNLYYISRDEMMNLLKNEYLKLQAKFSELTKIYKAKHPKMIRLKSEIAEIENQIERAKESKFDIDEFGTSTSNKRYAFEGFKANNVSIQDPAEIPIKPIRPKKMLNIVLSIIVGFFGGVSLAFFFEYLDDTIKTVMDVEKLVKWPFLGNVPEMSRGLTRFKASKRDTIVHVRPKDPVSEAYRNTRTSIMFSFTKENPIRSLIITSPGPQEGKTTTLLNIAIAMAQTKKKVLVVDADMRKPRLHRTFKLKNERGLSCYLSLQSEFDELVTDTNVNNLSVVMSGPHPPDPSELLSSNRITEFIEEAKKTFDILLFDTPPLAVVTDAVILSSQTDGITMVIEERKTSKRILPRIDQTIKNSKSKMIGYIMNRVTKSSSNPYYHYYAKYYGR